MTAVYLAERPVRSFLQIERPGPTLYAAERPSSSQAFGVIPPYLPDVAGLFDFDIQLSAAHSEIHIWGAAMPISIQLSATAYPVEYATADFTTSVELEVGKLAEYPFAIELSATVKMVANAAYQQAINLAATAYPIEVQTGPLTLATALSASAYPVELQTAVDNVALQLSATGYPIEISSASASLATALTAAGYPVELGGTVPSAVAVAFTATAYEYAGPTISAYTTAMKTTASSVTITLPSANVGDLWVIAMGTVDGQMSATPSGWTKRLGNGSWYDTAIEVWTRTKVAGDPATLTANGAGFNNSPTEVVAMTVTNQNGVNASSSVSSSTSTSATPHPTPAITTTVANALVIRMVSTAGQSAGHTWPAGTVSVESVINGSVGALSVATQLVGAAGSQAIVNATPSNGSKYSSGTIAIAPL